MGRARLQFTESNLAILFIKGQSRVGEALSGL